MSISWGGGGALHLALATCTPVFKWSCAWSYIISTGLHYKKIHTLQNLTLWQFFSVATELVFMLFCEIFLRVTKSKNLGAGPKVFSWKLSPTLTILFVFQGIMLVYDITQEETFDSISKWLRNIEEVIMTENNLISKERCIIALW